MDWMSTLATAIALLRLGLISAGMWLLLRTTARPLDFQKKCFAVAGIIYLLGLLPQSLLLLVIHSEFVGFLLDSGHLCGAQNIACAAAVALHSAIFLSWIGERLTARRPDRWRLIIAAYVAVLVSVRGFFLRREDGTRYYTELASRSNTSQWTTAPVEHPSQVIRLQLLLCECAISESEVWSFLATSYAFILLPFGIFCHALRSYIRRRQSSLVQDLDLESEKVASAPILWWEREDNIQRLLSACVAVWFFFIQPIIFALHERHFVDFGTHLLMTICVFIPWTLTQREQPQEQSWV